METNWSEELSGTQLPDQRYERNFIEMAEQLHKHTGMSFSAACGGRLRKSANRLFSKESLDLQSGHRSSLGRRVSEQGEAILVIEDTTDLNYHTHKATRGLGDIGGGKPRKKGEKYLAGLSMHVAMVSTLSGLPQGILGEHIWAPVNETRKSTLLKKLPITEKESFKWIYTLDWVKERLDYKEQPVYIVGDREGDFYEHYSLFKERNFPAHVNIVVRVLHKKRKVIHNGERISIGQLAQQLDIGGQRETIIRNPNGKKGESSVFDISYCPVICPASKNRTGPDVEMYLVKARQQTAFDGQTPLEWLILSTESVDSLEKAISIVEIYEKRWSIERFFYVLKQSLRVEKLQFDDAVRLKNALSLYNMIAWKIYRLSVLGKAHPEEAAEDHFEKEEIEILTNLTQKKIRNVKEYILALGTLTNFEPSSRQPLPGEKLLWQALKIFENIKRGVRLANIYGTG